MQSNNTLQKQEKKMSVGQYLAGLDIKAILLNTLGSEKAVTKFTANISSAVTATPSLQKCEPSTIVSSGLMANALNLSMSSTLGQCHIVPFEDNRNHRTVATFILGYKGYIQLAIRSGFYKHINVIEVKQGELEYFDPLTEEYTFTPIQDDALREQAETVGYLAYFEYLNGFVKAIYWTKKKMKIHAQTYSSGYAADIRKGTAYTFWSKDFDSMAKKTMLRQIISKWGIMSVDMQTAYEADSEAMGRIDNFTDPIPETPLKTVSDEFFGVDGVPDAPVGTTETIE